MATKEARAQPPARQRWNKERQALHRDPIMGPTQRLPVARLSWFGRASRYKIGRLTKAQRRNLRHLLRKPPPAGPWTTQLHRMVNKQGLSVLLAVPGPRPKRRTAQQLARAAAAKLAPRKVKRR